MSNHKGSAAPPRDELGELTPEEAQLIINCRKLNARARADVAELARLMGTSERHRKGFIDFQRARCRAIDAGEVRK